MSLLFKKIGALTRYLGYNIQHTSQSSRKQEDV